MENHNELTQFEQSIFDQYYPEKRQTHTIKRFVIKTFSAVKLAPYLLIRPRRIVPLLEKQTDQEKDLLSKKTLHLSTKQ